VDVGSATTFRELLTMVRDRTLRDLEHQHVPFEVLVKRLNPERDTAHTPLFQLMLVVQNNEEPTLELDGVRVRRVGLTDHVARTDLVLDVVQRADELAFRWKYDTALFQDDTMISMAGEFEQLLFDVSTDPSALAAPLHAAGAPRRRAGTAVFPLRVHDGSAEPVFALPGILGFGASFAQLAAHLGERPCHAINTRDLVDAGGDGLTTDRLLRMCADEVESVAGGTPVHLVGHSVGAALAYLLVDVLRNRGRDVLSLVLLDPPSPTEMGGEPDRPEPIVEFFGTIAHLIPDDVRARGEHLLARRADLGDDGVLEAAEALLPAHASAVLDGGLHRAFRDYSRMNALVWPAPRTTPVPTLVVRATGGLGAAAPDLTAAWANHLAGYHVLKDVPDSHEGMLRGEGAQRLGPLLSGFLDDVTARRGAQW
jgi:thioesterase domain-containing protein